jgi:hypothetical protein
MLEQIPGVDFASMINSLERRGKVVKLGLAFSYESSLSAFLTNYLVFDRV